MVVKSTLNARAMAGMEGRYILMPSGLTAETATSNAINEGRTIGWAVAGEVGGMNSAPIPETAANGLAGRNRPEICVYCISWLPSGTMRVLNVGQSVHICHAPIGSLSWGSGTVMRRSTFAKTLGLRGLESRDDRAG